MPESSFRRFYRRDEFLALPGTSDIDAGVLGTALGALVLSDPIAEVRLVAPPGTGVVVEWESLPGAGVLPLVDAAIAAFVGGATTSQPFIVNVAGPITAANNTPVAVVDFTTPPLDAGTYAVSWLSQFRLTATAANTASRAIAIVNGLTQQSHWGEAVVHAFNGSSPVPRTAGQTLRVQLQIAKLGAGAVNAEMTGARFTVDKIG